jgi:ferritin-like metal-binding protein YciE
MAEITARDAKLIQYLNEAYGKEKQLETALQAHIAMTTRTPYKRRLQDHLKETKGHARAVERRIKELGGTADSIHVPGPEVVSEAASKVQEVAQRGAALAQGPLHAVRGTGEEEKLLKNAKTEYADEAQEIATYSAIETLATSVGDRRTAQVARGIRRQEERMASFLERLIPQLTRAVAQAEIPASERNGTSRRRSTSRKSARARSGKSGGRSTSARKATSRSRSAGSRKGTSRSRSTSSRKGTSRSRSASRSRSRSGARRAGTRS